MKNFLHQLDDQVDLIFEANMLLIKIYGHMYGLSFIKEINDEHKKEIREGFRDLTENCRLMAEHLIKLREVISQKKEEMEKEWT